MTIQEITSLIPHGFVIGLLLGVILYLVQLLVLHALKIMRG